MEMKKVIPALIAVSLAALSSAQFIGKPKNWSDRINELPVVENPNVGSGNAGVRFDGGNIGTNSVVPEPASMLVLAAGAAFAAARRKKA
jgi:hypothetical protein